MSGDAAGKQAPNPSEASMRAISPGTVIGGCEIQALIARGGMGAVYLARQRLLDRPVAVKVMSPKLLRSRKTVKAFLLEGKVMAKLDHPSIVRVYSTVEEQGLYFLVMEYVQGRNLKQIVTADGPLTTRRALSITRQVAEVLAVAHEHGVIHLDVKPANVMLTETGQVKVTDFGISHLMKRDARDEQDGGVKLPGVLIGTPAYMSPEQCVSERVSAASDIYSLGATLYSLLTAKQPFRGRRAMDVIEKVIHAQPTALELLSPNLPEKVIALVHRMMAKDPKVRYQSGGEVVTAIDRILAGDLYPSRRKSTWTPKLEWKRLTWWHAIGAFAALWCLALVCWSLSPRLWASRTGDTADDTVVHAGAHAGPDGTSGNSGSGDAAPSAGQVLGAGKSLDASLRAFRVFLESHRSVRVVEFLPPETRRNPEVRRALMDQVELVQTQGIAAKATVDVSDQGAQEATTIFKLPARNGTTPFVIRLRWSRHRDGHWYILPELHHYLRG